MKRTASWLGAAACVALVVWLALEGGTPQRGREEAVEAPPVGALLVDEDPGGLARPEKVTGPVAGGRTPKVLPEPAEELRRVEVELVAVIFATDEGAGVAGVRLAVGLLDAAPRWDRAVIDAPPLATVRTGADGRARVTLELPRDQDVEEAVVWAETRTTGYQEIPAWKPIPLEGSVSLRVLAREGGTLTGVVVNGAGERIGGARVVLLYDLPERDELTSIDLFSTGDDGRFALSFFRDASYHVQAAARGHGTGSLRDLDVEARDPPHDLEIVVDGEGVLAGVVRDPSGEPMAHYELVVVPEDAEGIPGPKERYASEWSGGLLMDRPVTDGLGRFRAGGLERGAYFVLGSIDPGDPPERLHELPFATDDEAIELVVPRYRLEVLVLDADGRSVFAGAEEPPFGAFGLLQGSFATLPGAQVFLQESDGEGHVLATGAFRPYSIASDGTVVFPVEPERSYLYGAVSTEALATGEVFVARGEFRVRRELRLPPRRPPATLLVRVLRPDGRPHEEHHQIEVRTLPSRRLVAMAGVVHEESTWSATLPTGSYAVRAAAEPMRTHVGRASVARFSPVEETLDLLAGGHHELELVLGWSGRLEVTLDRPPAELPAGFWGEEPILSYWNLGDDLAPTLQEALGGVELALVPGEGGAPVRPLFEVTLPDESRLRTLEVPWVLPQSPATTVAPIPPGDYVLRGRGLAEARVTIRDGETTAVRIGAEQD